MATASTKKFIRNVAGTLTEEAAVLDTAGAADAGRIPALNGSGVLDSSLVNAKTTSAGAADAGKIPQLDGAGRLSATMMPAGFGDDVKIIVASEALAAGDLVNVWNDAGVAKVRKADATTSGKEAHGFVLSVAASGASASVYFEGANTACAGLTPGVQFLATTAGRTTSTAPSGAGNLVQRVGFAVSATEINLQIQDPVVLA